MPPALIGAAQGPTALAWQGPLHHHGDLGVVKNMQKPPVAKNALQVKSLISWQSPLHSHEGVNVVGVRKNARLIKELTEKCRKDKTCRIGSWNIGTLTKKSLELVECMKRR